MTFNARIGRLIVAMATLGVASVALGQAVDVVTTDPREAEAQAQAKRPFSLSVGYAHRFEANLDKNGRFSTDTTRIAFASQTALGRSLSWDNNVSYEFNYYDFANVNNSSNTAGGRWWKDTHFLTYVPSLRWKIDKHRSLFGGPVLQAAAESGADFSDGVTGGGLVGVVWTRDANLSIGGAIAGVSRIEDAPGLAPIPLIAWRFAEGWTLRSGVPDFGARRGFGLELGWGTKTFEIAGGAQFQRRRYRLDDDQSGGSPQADQRNGVGQETSVPLYAKFTLKMAGGATIDLFGGVAFAGEVKIEDENGHANSLDPNFDHKQEFDPAPVIGARLNFPF